MFPSMERGKWNIFLFILFNRLHLLPFIHLLSFEISPHQFPFHMALDNIPHAGTCVRQFSELCSIVRQSSLIQGFLNRSLFYKVNQRFNIILLYMTDIGEGSITIYISAHGFEFFEKPLTSDQKQNVFLLFYFYFYFY